MESQKVKENLVVLFAVESYLRTDATDNIESLLKSSGVKKVKFCKKCYKGRAGYRREDNETLNPIVCYCVERMLTLRDKNLNIKFKGN